jgi:hypothetical protein
MPPKAKKQGKDKEQADLSVALEIEKLKLEAAERERKFQLETAERDRRFQQEEADRQRTEAAKQREHELQLAQLQRQAKQKNQFQWKVESFPTFDEERDSIDTFIDGFERRAKLASEDQAPWVLWLGQVFCKGKVGEVYCRSTKNPNATYSEVKEALLAHFHITAEEYRRKFRNLRPTPKEMPRQFSRVLARHLDQWLDASHVDDFGKLKELLLSEQIMKCYTPEERIFVRQSQANNWEGVVSSLDAYVSARQYDGKATKTTSQPPASKDDQKEKDDKKGDNARYRDTECYNCKEKGHQARHCPKEKPLKSGGCASPPRHLQCDLDLHDDSSIFPVADGLVEGKKCQVLRDTGCGCIIVQRNLVPPTGMRQATRRLILIDGDEKEYPTARVSIQSPYLSGVVEVVVMDTPLYPCIIGNVDGAAGAEFSQRENVQDVDAGRESPPVQGNSACRDDTWSSTSPITLMEAINVEGLKEAATTPASGPADVGGVGGCTPPPTTEPAPRVREPTTTALTYEAGSSSTSAEGVDTCDAGGPDRGLSAADGSSPGMLLPQPAAAVTRAQAAESNRPPKRRPLGTIDAVGSMSSASAMPAAAATVVHENGDDVIPTFDVRPTTVSPDVNPDLSPTHKADLAAFIADFPDRLSSLPGRTDLTEHEVELTSDLPVRSRCYHTPYAMRKIIDDEIQKMIELDVIEPSKSSYASPVVLVVKKDKSYRFCVDYRRLNAITKFHAEPLPDVQHLFSKLQSAKYLSKIDLTKGYWQVPVPERDRHKTAFITHSGLWQWKVMPFGMMNSGATFSKMMKELLAGLDDVHHFIDDVIIGSEEWSGHLASLREVFTRLRQHHLTAKPDKCQLGYQQLEFLGHVVGKGVIQTETKKISKIADVSRPVNKKELRSFLGLAGYYQRFVPRFASIAAPLTDALKNGRPAEIVWTPTMDTAFTELKHRVSSAPVLHLADVSRPFVLRTDASDKGIGAVLLQDYDGTLFPVEYLSRKLKPAETRYAVTERECLALVWAIQKLQAVLYGNDFVVQTDHAPLAYLQNAKLENARVMRWALLLQQYQFRVVAIKGSANIGADFMSRCL